jgi:hypothetical protein
MWPFFLVVLLTCIPAHAQSDYPRALSSKLLEDFENQTGWIAESPSPSEEIRLHAALRKGRPAALSDAEAGLVEQKLLKPDSQSSVLGVKLEFLDVYPFEVRIRPPRPIPIGPRVWTISFWVYANNIAHALYLRCDTEDGRPLAELFVGTLNFIGWKRLTVAVPDFLRGIDLAFDGFRILCDPMDLYSGVLYYYFDVISADVVEAPG